MAVVDDRVDAGIWQTAREKFKTRNWAHALFGDQLIDGLGIEETCVPAWDWGFQKVVDQPHRWARYPSTTSR